VFLDRVDVGGGDERVDLVPAAAHEAAHAAHLLVVAARVRRCSTMVAQASTGVLATFSAARQRFQQAAAHHGVLHAVGAVQVPAE
jgi:hypothetical protein